MSAADNPFDAQLEREMRKSLIAMSLLVAFGAAQATELFNNGPVVDGSGLSVIRAGGTLFGAGAQAASAPRSSRRSTSDLVAHRVMAPDLLLHRSRRATAVQADHRVPAGLVGGGQVLDERAPRCACRRDGRIGTQHLGQRRRWPGCGPRPGPAGRRSTRPTRRARAVHVVDLRGQQQLADVGEHRLGHEVARAGSARHRRWRPRRRRRSPRRS
jgi:hypothetical protein